MPVYNCEKYVEKSIEHLLRQTYGNFELICIDDASVDSSWEVLNSLLEEVRDSRIRLIQFKNNVGRYKADNFAFLLSSGEYICINDADDYSVPDRIETAMLFLRRENAGIVGGQIRVLDEYGRLLQGKELRRRRHYYWAFTPPYNVNEFLKENPFSHAVYNTTKLISRRVLDKLGGFDNTRFGGDTEFILRASFFFRIRNSNEVYTMKTIRPDSLTEDPLTCITSPARMEYKCQRDEEQRIRLNHLREFGSLPDELIHKRIDISGIQVSHHRNISKERIEEALRSCGP